MQLPDRIPFNQKPIPGSEITLNVCQGLGDILWVYQKFAPYFKTIHFRIHARYDSDVARRALPWLKLLDQVGTAEVVLDYDPPAGIAQLAKKPCTMAEAFKQWKKYKETNYCCNVWMEEGIRLDEIDPGSQVLDAIAFKDEPFKLPFTKYAVLYVSGDTRHTHLSDHANFRIWQPDKWIRFAWKLWKGKGLDLPIVVIGADFDREMTDRIANALNRENVTATTLIGADPAKVVHLLKHAEFYVGYQSGLNVVADLLDVKQLMLYFANLTPMHYAWCKRQNIKTKFFAESFATEPDRVLFNLPSFPA